MTNAQKSAMPSLATKERNRTESAYAELRADLLACRLLPSAKLNIVDLTTRHGVSLGAVREALSRLTAEGLVIAEMNRGYRVAPVSELELLDLTSTRIEIEVTCLRLAIRAGGVEWESRIVAEHHRLSRTPERVVGDEDRVSDVWADAHKDFHAALVSACDSPWRLRLRSLLYDQTERYRRLSVPALPQERDIAAEHKALMDAALARDEKLAAKLITAHLNATTARVRALAQLDPEQL